MEPLAAVAAPERTAAQEQSLLHLVGQGPWSDEAVLVNVRQMVLPAVERHGLIEAWIIDGRGFPKKGIPRCRSKGDSNFRYARDLSG